MLGLTGVGKSTAVRALQASFTLLPNRRRLTDALIIPEMQRAAGTPVEPVTDRLERFELTRRYRELHPGGMVHALKGYLEAQTLEGELVFDNLRGLDEAKAAAAAFPDARFILLDAPPLVRLARLVGRADAFDEVAPLQGLGGDLQQRLAELEGLEAVFHPDELARMVVSGVPAEDVLKGVRIILSEAKNYDMTAAADYLRGVKNAQDFLYLGTASLSLGDVRAKIQAWL